MRVLHQRSRFACAGISDDTGQATRLAVDDRQLLRGVLQIGGHALVARSAQGWESRGGLIASRNALIGRRQTPGNPGNPYYGLGGGQQRRAMFSERCVAVHADTIASGMGESHVEKTLKKQLPCLQTEEIGRLDRFHTADLIELARAVKHRFHVNPFQPQHLLVFKTVSTRMARHLPYVM